MLDGSPSSLLTLGFGSWGSSLLVLTNGLGGEVVAPPTPISTDYIVALTTMQQPRGDQIVWQMDDGSLVVGTGYGPPAPITPSSSLVVGLYNFQAPGGDRIIQQDGSGAVKSRKGIA